MGSVSEAWHDDGKDSNGEPRGGSEGCFEPKTESLCLDFAGRKDGGVDSVGRAQGPTAIRIVVVEEENKLDVKRGGRGGTRAGVVNEIPSTFCDRRYLGARCASPIGPRL